MHDVYSIILIVSFSILTGCSHMAKQQLNGLPSLNDQRTFKVVQVAANFNPETRHDHPYFILCDNDCPQLTPKTPLRIVSLNQSRVDTSAIKKPDSKVETSNKTNVQLQSKNERDNKVPQSSNPLDHFTTHFDYASTEVSEYYQSLLRTFFETYPHREKTIRVTGFTDGTSIPHGTVPNEWLALERAVSVKEHLVFLGYPRKKILLEAKSLCCYIASNKKAQDRRLNRRAEIYFK